MPFLAPGCTAVSPSHAGALARLAVSALLMIRRFVSDVELFNVLCGAAFFT
jgi:hypothetical protein